MTINAIKLTSPHELLAVVPYLLGFNPTNSIMVLCLRDRRLGLAQRLDLPRSENAHDVASALLPSLIAENPDAVILLGFEDNQGESLPALETLTTALHSHSLPIHDRLVVRHGRWRSLDCHDPSGCPAEGRLVPEPAEVSAVISEFVGRGVAPHRDRQALARQVEPGPQAFAVLQVMRSRQRKRSKAGDCPAVPRAELVAAWPRILNPDTPAIEVDDAALVAVSLLDIEVRDGLVAWLCPGRGLRSLRGSGRLPAAVSDRGSATRGHLGRVPSFGPPKTPASVRVIPLPSVVVDALAAHLTTFPTEGLIFTNEAGDMIRRSNFGTMWRRVTKSVGLEGLHFHDLRHYYASLLIRHGESVKTVQARLGHANAAETLDTYSHLWPDSDDRTREAVDHVLGNPAEYILSTASTS